MSSEEPETLDEFVAKYGERAYYILKAIIDATMRVGGARLGDFDLKSLKEALSSYGLEYNPVPLLYSLEKRYGVIRTSYRSSQQHWWVIVDRKQIERAVASYEGRDAGDDYGLKLLRIQFYSLEPFEVLRRLKAAATADRGAKRKVLESVAFGVLPRLVEFLEKAKERYQYELSGEIRIAEEILYLAEALATSLSSAPSIGSSAAASSRKESLEAEVYDDALR